MWSVQLCLSCDCPPHLFHCTFMPLTRLWRSKSEQSRGIRGKTSSCEFLLLWGRHPHFVPIFLLPYISLSALERGLMSSCLRNALKMRSTEHFPNSPQFTFSTFSLGCQAFVVIFINSNRWLFPFLLRKTPPPTGTGYHPIADQPLC